MNVSLRHDSLQEAVDYANEMDVINSFQEFQKIDEPSPENDDDFDYCACHIPDVYPLNPPASISKGGRRSCLLM